MLTPSLRLTAPVTVPLIGGVSPMTPASYMTRASAPAPVPFPQLSPHVPSYPPIIPNPCALGQQVTVVLSLHTLSYCLVTPHVLIVWIIVSTYTIVLRRLIVLRLLLHNRPYLGPFSFDYIRWLWVA